jgi:hypothetical protein
LQNRQSATGRSDRIDRMLDIQDHFYPFHRIQSAERFVQFPDVSGPGLFDGQDQAGDLVRSATSG